MSSNKIEVAFTDGGTFPKELHDLIAEELMVYEVFNEEAVDSVATAILRHTAGKGQHLFARHNGGCSAHEGDMPTSCMICEGGLGMCIICGGLEAGLATCCPGYDIGMDLQKDIVEMTKDYLADGWTSCAPVWFGNHKRAVPIHSHTGTSLPYLAGYEITYTPGAEHEWNATKLPEPAPPIEIVIPLPRLQAEFEEKYESTLRATGWSCHCNLDHLECAAAGHAGTLIQDAARVVMAAIFNCDHEDTFGNQDGSATCRTCGGLLPDCLKPEISGLDQVIEDAKTPYPLAPLEPTGFEEDDDLIPF